MPPIAPQPDVDSTPSRQWTPEIISGCCFLAVAAIVARMMYHDSFVDGSTYSNRSFALPGAGFSLSIVVYGCVRLRRVPLWLRLLVAPFVFFVGYLGIGLALILINAAL
jgi:hypothetical protein